VRSDFFIILRLSSGSHSPGRTGEEHSMKGIQGRNLRPGFEWDTSKIQISRVASVPARWHVTKIGVSRVT
jgi:hypothetical protein